MTSKKFREAVQEIKERREEGDNPDAGNDDTDESVYKVQYREPAGYGGKWRTRDTFVKCDQVEVSGQMVRFILEGDDELAIQQENMIAYEKLR